MTTKTYKTYDYNGNETTCTIPSRVDWDTVEWYLTKFLQKMNGSSEQTAREWVEGINLDDETTEAIWSEIKKHPNTRMAK